MKIKVHVKGIKGSGAVKEGEDPSVLFSGLLEVNGQMIEEVTTIEAIFTGDSFVTVKPHLIPGLFEVVTHTGESWQDMLQNLNEEKQAVGGANRLIAQVEGD